MIFRESLERLFVDTPLAPWLESLPPLLERRAGAEAHGRLREWQAVVEGLPEGFPSSVDLRTPRVRIGAAEDLGSGDRERLKRGLEALHPWRKGPLELFGITIDAEWRSDWKWSRLQHHIEPLAGRRVLDVGCGNGYHLLRMVGEGAELVVGIDPTQLHVMQFRAVARYLSHPPVTLLPLSLEALPPSPACFDTLFSMGVIYHRRSPLDHLFALRERLRPGGELVLESLVVEGGPETVLLPAGRYARMRNVWFLPSVRALERWLVRSGFEAVRCIHQGITSPAEQRSTPWMRFESLEHALDPLDPSSTVESLPAPRRAILLARRPA